MCIGCRRVAEQSELTRVTVGEAGKLVVGRQAPGRGAWLCADSPACVEAARRRKAFSRALRTDISLSAVAALQTELADRARMEGSASSGQRDQRS